MSLVPHDFQLADQRRLEDNNFTGAVVIEPGGGKAQPLDSLVLTPDGFIRMGDVSVGTRIVVPSGGDAAVSGVFPQGIRDVYHITFKDGRTVLADSDHLWTLWKPRYDKHNPGKRYTLTTAQVARDVRMVDGRSKWAIERIEAPDLGNWESSIPPYVLGLLLGDGGLSQNSVMFTTTDSELLDAISDSLPDGLALRRTANDSITYRISGVAGAGNPWLRELRRLGIQGKLSKDKSVPRQLLHSKAADRLALLQGLLDSDGTPNKNGAAVALASRDLLNDIIWLTRSLGGEASFSTKQVQMPGWDSPRAYYKSQLRLPDGVIPFRLQRKIDKMVPATKYRMIRHLIREVEYVGKMPTQCIMVDHPDHEYVTDDFVRTHNTVTAALAGKNSGANLRLLVAPQQTHYGEGDGYEWTIAQLEPSQRFQALSNGSKSGKTAWSDLHFGVSGTYAITPQLFARTDWSDFRFDLAIIDEVHLIAGGGVSTKRLIGSGRMNPETKIRSDALRADMRIAMSGTPVRNKFANWYTLARFLWPERNGLTDVASISASAWRDEWMALGTQEFWTKDVPYGAEVLQTKGAASLVRVKDYVGEKEPGRFAASLPCFIQHFRRANCCEFHPNGFLPTEAPQVIHEHIELTAGQKRAIAEMEESYLSRVDGGEIVARIAMTAEQRIRQMTLAEASVSDDQVVFAEDAKSPKLDRAIEIVQSIDDQVVLFTSSKIFAGVAARRMNAAGIPTAEYSGNVSAKDRESVVPAFQRGDIRAVVVTIAAGGTGLSGFHKVSQTEIWFDSDVDPTNNVQAESRVDRMGGKGQVQRFYLQDTLGWDAGRMTAQLQARELLALSNRVEVSA